MAQKVLFKRKSTTEIENLPVEDGSLIYNIENGKTYMDYGEERIPTGGGSNGGIYVGNVEPTDEDITLYIDEKENQDYDLMSYRNSKTKQWEQLKLSPTGDTLPIGSIVDYDGTEVPYGYEKVDESTKILWTNPNPNKSFEPQTITLNSTDYDMYEIIYVNDSAAVVENSWVKTAKSIKGRGTQLILANAQQGTYRRNVTTNTAGDKLTFTISDSSNNFNIPLYVIGYKTGLF